jgi:hypothetical protein
VQVLLVGTLALAGSWLTGCSTTVYKQGDRAAGSAQVAAFQAQTERQALAGTLATLTNLAGKPAADLKPQFESFNAALDGLAEAAKQGGVTGERLVRSNAVFLAAWAKDLTTITNADVRSRSETRRTEVSKQIDVATSHYKQAQDALWSLIHYLQDVRRALSTDLTAQGVEALKPSANNANATASKVQDALSQANTSLTALSAQMSSARGTAPK